MKGTVSVFLLLLGAAISPWPWALLWLVIPATAAVSLLLTWRFGRPALVLPALLALAAVALAFVSGPMHVAPWFGGWTPAASAVGAWMGLREEGGGAGLGERAWMFSPLLALAAVLPVLPGFATAIAGVDRMADAQQQQLVATVKPGEAPSALLDALRDAHAMAPAERQRRFTFAVPNTLFLWAVVLTAMGRSLAARVASMLRWPSLSRAPLAAWRLPDPVLVPFMAGIALFVFADRTWHPSAATLLVHTALGYSVQGVAVVQSILLSRGLPSAIVALTMLFVIAASLLWALPAIAVLGLSDVWFDYRRLEPSFGGEA